MSYSSYIIARAGDALASAGARRLRLDPEILERLAPFTAALILRRLNARTGGVFGRQRFSMQLRRFREDVLRAERIGDADVRARGAAALPFIFDGRQDRAAAAISELASISPVVASAFLQIAAAAVMSALANVKSKLKLKSEETRAIIKSEAAAPAEVDLYLLREVYRWIYPEPWWRRLARNAAATLFPRRADRAFRRAAAQSGLIRL